MIWLIVIAVLEATVMAVYGWRTYWQRFWNVSGSNDHMIRARITSFTG